MQNTKQNQYTHSFPK